MRNLIQDLRYGVRMLRRNPGFATIAVLALALGIGVNTAVFTVVNGVLLRPMPFPDPERLFLISYAKQHGPFENGPSMLDSDYLEFRRQDQVFERITSFAANSVNLTGAGDPVHIPAASVTPDFFSVLRADPAIGRAFLVDEDRTDRNHVTLLSDKLWRDRFGADSHILGRTVTLDGVRHTVVGVMAPGFTFPYGVEAWTPFAIKLDSHNAFMRPVIGRLKSGVSREKALSELKTIMSRLPIDPQEHRMNWQSEIVPLKELLVTKIRASLWIFTGAVGFVLLIVCVNVANLLLARAAGRQQEIAVRIAMGASRWRLIRQLLTESMLISLAGGAAGILLALWGVPALIAMAPEGKVPRVDQIHLDNWVLAFTAGVSLVSGLLFGLAPALRATRRELRESVNQSGRPLTGHHEGVLSALVVSEMALALVLLTGAALMLKSFLRLRAVNPGFRAQNLLTMTVELPDAVYQTPPQVRAFHQRMLSKLANLPGVLAAGAVNLSPLGLFLTRGDFQLEGGRRFPPHYSVDKLCASPGYFRTMGIAIRRGRDFTERDDTGAPGAVIVSQSAAARVWPGEDPIGKRITEDDHPKPEDWFTIVGVVDDIRQLSLAANPDPALYYPYLQVNQPSWLRRMTFAVRTASNPLPLVATMRGALGEIDRDQPVMAMTTMQEMMAASTAETRFQTRLLGAFSLLAVILAAVGIYGVLAYAVTQRTHEIGIRMALGAESADVLRMVLRRTVMLAGAGIVLGAAGALAVTRVLAKFLFEVKPTDPTTFIAVAALLAGIALLAGAIPARRAATVDPMVALRYE